LLSTSCAAISCCEVVRLLKAHKERRTAGADIAGVAVVPVATA